ncbi:MAG: cysteine desulfurase family protein [Actinomycetota bacterium]|nr:cysteine desulfurase family protein [Actinomycetota bacterium]
MEKSEYLYLDHAATTPMREVAIKAFIDAEHEGFANSSGGHNLSRRAKNILEDSREIISSIFGVTPNEIIFTSGGTEADNWSIKSLFNKNLSPDSNLVTTDIEHEAVLASAQWIQENDYQVTFTKCFENGVLDKDSFLKAINENTIIASAMWANNETGIVQPIKELSKEIKKINSNTLFHSDVVQAVVSDRIDFHKDGIQSAAISAHKIGGPKGVGAMFLSNQFKLPSMLHGGKQELERRAGTVNVAGIASFASALKEQHDNFDDEIEIMLKEKEEFEQFVKDNFKVKVIGENEKRLAHISNIQFEKVNSEILMVDLDLNGLGVSRGSACASGAQKPSHVLEAMKVEKEYINNHLRFSFGWSTNLGDGKKAARILLNSLEKIA